MTEKLKAEVIETTAIEKFEVAHGAPAIEFSPAVITADFDAMATALDKIMEPYEGMTLEALAEMPEKDLKAVRADINRIIKNVDGACKAVNKAYSEPYKAFKERVQALLAPAHEKADILASAVNEKERLRKAAKYEQIEDAYLEYAPALAPVVTFDQLLDNKWLNKTPALPKAIEELYAKVDEIAANWEALKKQLPSMKFAQEAEAEFFRTLDLGAAISLNSAREAEQERIEAMRAEVEANRQAQAPEPMPEPTPEPTPEADYSAVSKAVQHAEEVEPDPAIKYRLTIWLTPTEREALKGWLTETGIGTTDGHKRILEAV